MPAVPNGRGPARPTLRLAGACLMLGLIGVAPLRAQGASDSAAVISGRVVNAETGHPLLGAAISFGKKGREVLTDSAGRFAVRVAAGTYPLRISQLGYRDQWRAIDIDAAARPASLEVRLEPDPVLLEGITAIADRFRARRNAVSVAVRAFDRQRLLATGAQNMAQFLEEDAFLHRAACRGGSFSDVFLDCAWVRGRATPIQVYIDDMPKLGGLNELAMYHPSEMYLIEVYAGGRQVRAYTTWWVAFSARHHIRPQPVILY